MRQEIIGEGMIGQDCRLRQKTSEARKETLFERCGADRALYLSCKSVMEGTLAPFSVGSWNDGGLLHIGRKEAAVYVREYERKAPAPEPGQLIFQRYMLRELPP